MSTNNSNITKPLSKKLLINKCNFINIDNIALNTNNAFSNDFNEIIVKGSLFSAKNS